MVILPLLLRPPEDVLVFTMRLFSGLSAVISAKSDVSLYLNVGVSGRYFLNAILNFLYLLNTSVKINNLSLFQGYDRLFIAVNAANSHTTSCIAGLYFTHILLCVYRVNFHVVHFLYSRFDLELISFFSHH